MGSDSPLTVWPVLLQLSEEDRLIWLCFSREIVYGVIVISPMSVACPCTTVAVCEE